ncbi:hypothetical protein D9M73_156680 [compost metagenome]
MQFDIATLDLHLGHAIEQTYGKVGVAHAGAKRTGLEFQRLSRGCRNFEERFALVQAGHVLLRIDVTGKRRIGVEQNPRAIFQLQALALTDHGQVIGLQAHGHVAEADQADDKGRGRGQGFPVGAQALQRRRAALALQDAGGLAHSVAVPHGLGFDVGLGVRGVGIQPGGEFVFIVGRRAL